jgi:hypothetical protein
MVIPQRGRPGRENSPSAKDQPLSGFTVKKRKSPTKVEQIFRTRA